MTFFWVRNDKLLNTIITAFPSVVKGLELSEKLVEAYSLIPLRNKELLHSRLKPDSATEQIFLALAFKAWFFYVNKVESGLKGETLRFPESICSSAKLEKQTLKAKY